MDVRDRRDLWPVLVVGGAGFQVNRPCGDIDLAHLEVDEFADFRPVSPSHLDYRLEPEIGAVCDQLFVLCVFEEAGTDIVFSQLGKSGQTEDLRQCSEHADTEHPLKRSHLAFESLHLKRSRSDDGQCTLPQNRK